jgi:hypothetical protein
MWKNEKDKDGVVKLARHPSGLVVHRHMSEPTKWFASYYRVGIENRTLKATELQDACEEAKSIARSHLQNCLKGLEV